MSKKWFRSWHFIFVLLKFSFINIKCHVFFDISMFWYFNILIYDISLCYRNKCYWKECLEVQFVSYYYNNLLWINEHGRIVFTNLHLNWNGFQGKIYLYLLFYQTNKLTTRKKKHTKHFLLLWGNSKTKWMSICNLFKGIKVTWYRNFK